MVEGRRLSDSVLIVNEIIEDVGLKRKICIIVKVGCEKTYNSLIWNFIHYDGNIRILN